MGVNFLPFQFFSPNRFVHQIRKGEAIKHEDQKPITTPRDIATAKSWIATPPKKARESVTNRVEKPVQMERPKLWLYLVDFAAKVSCRSACSPYAV